MKLSKLLERLDYTIISGPKDPDIADITNDSRKVGEDSLFF